MPTRTVPLDSAKRKEVTNMMRMAHVQSLDPDSSFSKAVIHILASSQEGFDPSLHVASTAVGGWVLTDRHDLASCAVNSLHRVTTRKHRRDHGFTLSRAVRRDTAVLRMVTGEERGAIADERREVVVRCNCAQCCVVNAPKRLTSLNNVAPHL